MPFLRTRSRNRGVSPSRVRVPPNGHRYSLAANSFIVWLTNQGPVSEPTTLNVYLTP